MRFLLLLSRSRTPRGNVLASSQADQPGNAVLNIAQYHMPLQAYIRTYSLGVMVASTPSLVSIWGGDVYSVSALGLGLGNGLSVPTSAPSQASTPSVDPSSLGL